MQHRAPRALLGTHPAPHVPSAAPVRHAEQEAGRHGGQEAQRPAERPALRPACPARQRGEGELR